MSETQSTEKCCGGQQSPAKKKQGFNWRVLTSLLLTGLFTIMLFSGSMLYLSPKGRVANWTSWTLCGLTKEQWGAVHINVSILFVTIAIVHLVYNWRMFWGYIKSRTSGGLSRPRELAVALTVSVLVVAACVMELPPFANVIALNGDIQTYWEDRSASAPMPHAEEMPLGQFAAQIGVNPVEMMEILTEEGYEPKPGMTVQELADQKGLAPNEILTLVQEKMPESKPLKTPGSGGGGGAGLGGGGGGGGAGLGGGGGGGGAGLGRGAGAGNADLSVGQYAAQIGVESDQVKTILIEAGYEPKPGMTIRDLASQKGVMSKEVIALIQEKIGN